MTAKLNTELWDTLNTAYKEVTRMKEEHTIFVTEKKNFKSEYVNDIIRQREGLSKGTKYVPSTIKHIMYKYNKLWTCVSMRVVNCLKVYINDQQTKKHFV